MSSEPRTRTITGRYGREVPGVMKYRRVGENDFSLVLVCEGVEAWRRTTGRTYVVYATGPDYTPTHSWHDHVRNKTYFPCDNLEEALDVFEQLVEIEKEKEL